MTTKILNLSHKQLLQAPTANSLVLFIQPINSSIIQTLLAFSLKQTNLLKHNGQVLKMSVSILSLLLKRRKRQKSAKIGKKVFVNMVINVRSHTGKNFCKRKLTLQQNTKQAYAIHTMWLPFTASMDNGVSLLT